MNKAAIFASLPSEADVSLLPQIQSYLAKSPHKLVVLDDDPTGTQTVHDVSVLTSWTVDVLQAEFQRQESVFYILTNSRSLSPSEAAALNTEIAQNLLAAADGTPFHIVSRSDSTLRGHFPLELRALSDGLSTLFDGWLIVPFFEEGGRFTIDGIHYILEGDDLIPAHQTPFARDATFGYSTAVMADWVEEKTQGQVKSEHVVIISLETIRKGGVEAVSEILMTLADECVCAVDAVSYGDIEILVLAVLQAEAQGKRFLYRTAASFVRTRAGLDSHPLLSGHDLTIDASIGGLVVVGSYVPKTTSQLNHLLEHLKVTFVTLEVDVLLSDERDKHIADVAEKVNQHLIVSETVVLYTSRKLATGVDAQESLQIGQKVSDSLITVLQRLTQRPSFIVAKGGITSSDVATKALAVKRAIVKGQIAPGVPVWELDANSRYPDLPYIIFPGNVGDESMLTQVVQRVMIC